MVPSEDDSTIETEVSLFRPDEKDKGISAYQMWQLHKELLSLRQEYLDHWEGTVSITGTGRPVDAIICPSAPYAAPPHGKNWFVE